MILLLLVKFFSLSSSPLLNLALYTLSYILFLFLFLSHDFTRTLIVPRMSTHDTRSLRTSSPPRHPRRICRRAGEVVSIYHHTLTRTLDHTIYHHPESFYSFYRHTIILLEVSLWRYTHISRAHLSLPTRMVSSRDTLRR